MKWIAIALMLCACGDAADSQLVDIADEPPGANCTAGGTAISVGFDRNGDGTLQAEDVDTVEYVCDGDDGEDGMDGDDPAPVLVETRPEDPGANCENGGVAIASGLDLDADGVLDPDEITSTSFVCDGTLGSVTVLAGPVVIQNQLDAALLGGVVEITGGLFIEAPGVEVELPDLERVGSIGALGVGARAFRAPNLVTAGTIFVPFGLDLPRLEAVTNELVIHGSAPPDAAVILPELRSVGTKLQIFTTELERFSAPKLAQIDGPLIVTGSPALGELDLSSLVSVRQIQFVEVPALVTLRLGAVVDLPGGLSLFDTGAAVLPALASLQTASSVGLSPELGHGEYVMPNLRAVGDLFVLDGEISAARFPSLQTVSGVLDIQGESIVELEMPSVTGLGTNVRVDAPSLDGCIVLAILAQANYTGPRTLETLPCP
jgi:hypothetical protein